jgi:hypothetical protein
VQPSEAALRHEEGKERKKKKKKRKKKKKNSTGLAGNRNPDFHNFRIPMQMWHSTAELQAHDITWNTT